VRQKIEPYIEPILSKEEEDEEEDEEENRGYGEEFPSDEEYEEDLRDKHAIYVPPELRRSENEQVVWNVKNGDLLGDIREGLLSFIM
jgi:hypothetical protein